MNASRFILPFILVFGIITALVFGLKPLLIQNGFNITVLMVSNGLLLLLTLLVFLLQKKSLQSSNPQRLVQAVMLGVLLKMVVVATTVLIYSRTAGKDMSKPSILAAMGFYMVYLLIEVISINKLNKRKHA